MHPITNQLKILVEKSQFSGVGEEVIRVQVKEILQDYLLKALYSSAKYNQLIFIGGTALRKLYRLPRMSEDLDFVSTSPVELPDLAEDVLGYFAKIRFEQVTAHIQHSAEVNRVTLKFGILHELGLSPIADEKIHVKIELTHTHFDFQTQTSLYTGSSMLIPIRHYSLQTMMAGKIVACLHRVWKKGTTGITVKGRDYFDLLWYMEQQIAPDYVFLKQSDDNLTKKTVFIQLDEKVKLISSEDLLADLRPFFPDLPAITEWCNNFHAKYSQHRTFY